MDIGILRRRAASEKLLASTTFANTTSELRSVIAFLKNGKLMLQHPYLMSKGMIG